MEDMLLMRRRDAARVLAVSESQLMKWERAHPPVITPVRIPGIRAVRYSAIDVRSLAANLTLGRLSTEPVEDD